MVFQTTKVVTLQLAFVAVHQHDVSLITKVKFNVFVVKTLKKFPSGQGKCDSSLAMFQMQKELWPLIIQKVRVKWLCSHSNMVMMVNLMVGCWGCWNTESSSSFFLQPKIGTRLDLELIFYSHFKRGHNSVYNKDKPLIENCIKIQEAEHTCSPLKAVFWFNAINSGDVSLSKGTFTFEVKSELSLTVKQPEFCNLVFCLFARVYYTTGVSQRGKMSGLSSFSP